MTVRAIRLGAALALARVAGWLHDAADHEARAALDEDAFAWGGDIAFPVPKRNQAFDDPEPYEWLNVSEHGIRESIREVHR